MKAGHKILNLMGVVLPFAGLVAAIALLWETAWVGPSDLAIMAVIYVLTAYGVTLGFHRLLTHRSFATHKPVEYGLAILGSVPSRAPSCPGWPTTASTTRTRTPTAIRIRRTATAAALGGALRGLGGALRGLYYAHMGRLFDRAGQAPHDRYARDFFEDAGMQRIHRLFPLWVVLGIALPFGLGHAIDGHLAGGLTAALWGGAVRIFLLHHVTWSINSVCLFFGTRRLAVDDHSTNVFWLSLLSMGESWHHNHHAFPRSAVHGLRWYEIDPTGWAVRALRRLRLAWNVVEISPERQQQLLASHHG